MEISTQQAPQAIKEIVKAGLVTMIHGSPGVGKSDIVRQVANHFNLKLIDFRLSQVDPVLLMGFPNIPTGSNKAGFTPLRNFPLKNEPTPEGKDGWLIFFDEINTAAPSVQAAAYKIILDRMVGDFELNKKVVMVAAGNLSTDKAITNRMSTAMQSRMVHLNLHIDDKAWLNWATESDIDFRIRSFIKFKPDLLQKFDPNHSDNTFACPRTWSFLSKLIKNKETLDTSIVPIMAGTVGEGVALEFKAFTDIMSELPSFETMLAKPTEIPIPDDPSTLYAMTGLIAHKGNPENLDTLMKLVLRFPLEFQTITIQELFSKYPEADSIPSVDAWITKNMKELASYATT